LVTIRDLARGALQRVRRLATQPGLVVIVSNFCDPAGWQRALHRGLPGGAGSGAVTGPWLGSRIGTRKERREVRSSFAGGARVLLLGGLSCGVRWRARIP
jgi:hypothetical protein